jgi:hypothetical protein
MKAQRKVAWVDLTFRRRRARPWRTTHRPTSRPRRGTPQGRTISHAARTHPPRTPLKCRFPYLACRTVEYRLRQNVSTTNWTRVFVVRPVLGRPEAHIAAFCDTRFARTAITAPLDPYRTMWEAIRSRRGAIGRPSGVRCCVPLTKTRAPPQRHQQARPCRDHIQLVLRKYRGSSRYDRNLFIHPASSGPKIPSILRLLTGSFAGLKACTAAFGTPSDIPHASFNLICSRKNKLREWTLLYRPAARSGRKKPSPANGSPTECRFVRNVDRTRLDRRQYVDSCNVHGVTLETKSSRDVPGAVSAPLGTLQGIGTLLPSRLDTGRKFVRQH